MSGLDSVEGGAERVAKALDFASNSGGRLGTEARAEIFAAIDAEPGTPEARAAWEVARARIVHDSNAAPKVNLWRAVAAYLARGGRALSPDATPDPAVIVAAIERTTTMRPGRAPKSEGEQAA
ncbi:hypothetical protein [Agromyces sp. NPDC058104]|uniref:hypothetical protein n=1 Tax=Agromyces sp. NPDC058104 TaxID=3346342 RepID=UPI0036D852F0